MDKFIFLQISSAPCTFPEIQKQHLAKLIKLYFHLHLTKSLSIMVSEIPILIMKKNVHLKHVIPKLIFFDSYVDEMGSIKINMSRH